MRLYMVINDYAFNRKLYSLKYLSKNDKFFKDIKIYTIISYGRCYNLSYVF